jgi:hypothetical protein
MCELGRNDAMDVRFLMLFIGNTESLQLHKILLRVVVHLIYIRRQGVLSRVPTP